MNMGPNISQMTIPSRMEYLSAVTAYVLELARTAGFEENEINQIHLAVEEAVTNVIRHGLEMNPEETFTIVCELSDCDMQIRIREKGVPFDPSRLPRYSPDSPLEDSSGLGTFLMKESMDEVRYVNQGRQGKELCLVKRLKKRRIDEQMDAGEKMPPPAESQSLSPKEYTIRAFIPEDAIEVSKCAYRAYGYTYADYIYYPEKIVEYNRSGLMASLVAVSGDGELMGHAALKFPYPNAPIAEIGVAFVKPKFMRLGLFNMLISRLIEKGRSMGLAGVTGIAVTSHPISQKMASRQVSRDCGIFLGAFPSDLDFKSLVGRTRQKESGVLSFLSFHRTEKRDLFPPAEHREMVKRLFREMAISVEIPETGMEVQSHSESPSRIESSTVSVLNTAEILVIDYNDSTFEELRDTWRRIRLEKIDVIYLFLNMENPHCARFAEQCKGIGFFFSGVLPSGASGKHALILQYLNNLKIDYSLIKPYSKTAQDLIEYIQASDPDNT
jgi:serine/threonine-protein kinase RsbW